MKYNEARKIMKAAQEAKREIEKMTSAAGIIAKNHFVASFRNQGFTDEILDRWKARQKADSGRAILVKSGALRRSIRSQSRGMFKVVISSNLPYAQIHNDGGYIAKKAGSITLNFNARGRFQRQRTERQRSNTSYSNKAKYGTHGIIIPKRQFIGNSGILNRKIIATFEKQINEVFK